MLVVIVMTVMVSLTDVKHPLLASEVSAGSLMARIKDHLSIENLHTENHSIAGITYLENDLNKILLNWGTIVQRYDIIS